MLMRSVDAAGNAGAAVATSYELDRTDPGAPEFTSTPGASGDDPTPKWVFKAERDAHVECRLVQVGKDDPVEDWKACKSPASYNLGKRDDATYRLMLRATDEAGNTGASARDDYELKRTSAAEAKRDAAGGDAGAGAGAGPDSPAASPAASPESPAGSPAAKAGDASAKDDRAADTEPGSPEAAGRGGAAGTSPGQAGSGGSNAGGAPEGGKKKGLAKVADLPVIRNLGEAAKVIAENADKSVFPTSLLLIVGLFLLVQKRIDRGDPKLALAPAFADPDLEFRPPPTLR
jgi:hypothetical protein